MKITSTVYQQLCAFPAFPPEAGAMLGCDESELVCAFCFDKGIPEMNSAVYRPCADRLNAVLTEWAKEGIRFCGLAHSHPPAQRTLSNGDKAYIQSLIRGLPPQFSPLYFPIVLPHTGVFAFRAVGYGNCMKYEEEQLIVKEVSTVEKAEKLIIPVICDGLMCAKNCSDGCLYWEPYNRDNNGRQYCNYYGTYYYPSERNGCGPFREV